MQKNNMAIAAVVVIIAALAAGYVLLSGVLSPSVVSGDTVGVYYTGAFTNGTVFNSNVGSKPLTFIVGAGQVIPGFDQAVVGMGLGQNKTVTIPVNQAYGPVNPALIVSVPVNDFGSNTLTVGEYITQTTQSGQQLQGVVTAVNATNVTVDFNSPLAGHALVFTIKVVNITKG